MSGARRLALVSLLVPDYDAAIAYYTGVLDFVLVADSDQGGGKRWVVIAPAGDAGGTRLLLARGTTPAQVARIGEQAGGRVFLFLHTDDIWRDYRTWQARGVAFREPPRADPYGTVAVFADRYGTLWDLIQPPAL